jgi:hypothetical protein
MRETQQSFVRVRINRGLLQCECTSIGNISVNMGEPLLHRRDVRLSRNVNTLSLPLSGAPTACRMGNPHCTFFVNDLSAIDVAALGPTIEHHPLFPQKTNVHFVQLARMGARRGLHGLGFSPQKPTRRALERDEERIQAWIEQDWPRVKKRRPPECSHRFPRRIRHAHGFPGAPLLESARAHPGASAAGPALSKGLRHRRAGIPPARDRIALYFRLHPAANVNTELAMDFLDHLQR